MNMLKSVDICAHPLIYSLAPNGASCIKSYGDMIIMPMLTRAYPTDATLLRARK